LKVSSQNQIQKTGAHHGHFLLHHLVYPCRRAIINTFEKSAGPASPILIALFLWDKSKITKETLDRFSSAGVIHIFAVSGLHVGYILIIVMTLFSFFRLPYAWRVFSTLAILTLFVLINQVQPSVLRASLMAGFYLISTLLEKRTDPLNIVGISALIILLIRPGDLFHIGFQLSFTAVLSIIYIYPKLSNHPISLFLFKKFHTLPIIHKGLHLFLVSLAAQLGTLPLVAVYFNRVPLLASWTGLIAIPVAGVVVAVGFITLLSACIHPWLAMVYGSFNQTLIELLVMWINSIGQLSFSSLVVPSPHPFMIAQYWITLLLIVHFFHPLIRKRLIFCFLVGLNLIVWTQGVQKNLNMLTWIQFDVGQGDAALIQLPRGRVILVDTGNKSLYLDTGQDIIAPYLRRKGIRHVDMLILTHGHADHVGGYTTLNKEFTIKKTVASISDSNHVFFAQLKKNLESKGSSIQWVAAGDTFLFPGTLIQILSPIHKDRKIGHSWHEENNRSVVFRLLYGRITLLFMGDAEKAVETDLIHQGYDLVSDGLKVGHHGSDTSTSFPFVSCVQPSYAVISVGRNNQFGHPNPEVMNRLKERNVHILRTDQMGALMFQTDGKCLELIHWQ
jgi:competence protein ComEC